MPTTVHATAGTDQQDLALQDGDLAWSDKYTLTVILKNPGELYINFTFDSDRLAQIGLQGKAIMTAGPPKTPESKVRAQYELPHFKQPFTHGSYVEQDTVDHIQSCQYTVASCPAGFRDDYPEFGWTIPAMRQMPVDFSELVDALKQFEPRQPNVTTQQAEDVFGETVEVLSEVDASVSD